MPRLGAASTRYSFLEPLHQHGLAPYIVFEGRSDHGDGEILGAQRFRIPDFARDNR